MLSPPAIDEKHCLVAKGTPPGTKTPRHLAERCASSQTSSPHSTSFPVGETVAAASTQVADCQSSPPHFSSDHDERSSKTPSGSRIVSHQQTGHPALHRSTFAIAENHRPKSHLRIARCHTGRNPCSVCTQSDEAGHALIFFFLCDL